MSRGNNPLAVVEGTKDSVNVFLLLPFAAIEGTVQEIASMSLCFVHLQSLKFRRTVSMSLCSIELQVQEAVSVHALISSKTKQFYFYFLNNVKYQLGPTG